MSPGKSYRLKWKLIVLSTIASVALFSVFYEVYKRNQYEKWKADYKNEGNWYGTLTVASSNPRLMWEYRPYGKYVNGKKGYTIITNRYGLRGLDRDLSLKQPFKKRIAFLGDSATLGLFVNDEETFVRKFEDHAAGQCSNVAVESVNCAVDGYHTLQLLELLKTKVVTFSPDSVVYVMHLNDFDFEFSAGDKFLYFQKPRNFLLNDIRNALWPVFYDYYDYSFDRHKEDVFNAITEMSALLRERNIEFSVALLPTFVMIHPNFKNYPHWELHQRVGEFLVKEKIRFLDLALRFNDLNLSPATIGIDVWHLNPKGHDTVARQMIPFVLQKECSGAGTTNSGL